jgi:hypothetical protein
LRKERKNSLMKDREGEREERRTWSRWIQW